MAFDLHDTTIIRGLEKQLAEAAVYVEMAVRRRRWVEHNSLRSAYPMMLVFPEGAWGELMDLIRRCHEEALKDGERVVTTIKIDDYKGKGERLDTKLESVERKLGQKLNR